MSRRLQWSEPANDQDGAFAVSGSPLWLLWREDAAPDRLGQPPRDRDGLTIEGRDQGLWVQASGEVRLYRSSTDGPEDARTELEIPYGKHASLDFTHFDGMPRWRIKADGEVSTQDPLIGKELGGYRILARLGSGAVGVVYRALQLKLDREVALKVLSPGVARKSPLAVASFKREAVAAGRLSHPNLVQVYDVGHDQGLHFFSMEIVPAGDLEDRLKEVGPLPWSEASSYLLDCAEALAFAEEHHLVHRDVKPENLMLTVDGRAKLADLGMAATRNMLEQESAGGTPHFMAPECLGSAAVDHRADLYSLGCTMYRLLTGKTPFDGSAVKDILRGHRDEPVPQLKDAGADAPAGVQDLLDHLMAKSPDDRPQHAREVVEQIHDLLEGKRSPLLFIAVSVIALGAIGTALFYAFRPPTKTEPEKVIVKVGEEEAAAAQAKNAQLQRELAFTQAMGVAEGPDRIAALQSFSETYPDSEFAERVSAELERLANLPVEDNVESTGPSEEELLQQQLAAFEAGWNPLLEQKAFGQAHQQLTLSPLPAEILAPLWARLDRELKQSLEAWKVEHQAFLTQEDFAAAKTVRDEQSASYQGADPIPQAWSTALIGLEENATSAEVAARQRAFDQARSILLQSMKQDVLTGWTSLSYEQAGQALAQAAQNCTHPGLATVATKRVVGFEQAATSSALLLRTLSDRPDLAITEPMDHKRAFAQGASPQGLSLLVQVRGERVPRVDPWTAFASAEDWRALLDVVLVEEAGVDPQDLGMESLYLLHGLSSLAEEMNSWATLPRSADAGAFADRVDSWLLGLRVPPTERPAWMQAEIIALEDVASFARNLAKGEEYLALQSLQNLGQHFSLFGCAVSSGESTWGLEP